MSHGIFIAAQSAEDAERFVSIGANPARTHVVGNIKFDFGYPPDMEARGHELRRLLGVHRPVWVAGSTHAKEEELLLDAHRADPRALLRTRCWCWCRAIRRASPTWRRLLRDRGVPFVTRTSRSRVTARHAGVPAGYARRIAGVLRRG